MERLKIEYIPITDLEPYLNNAKKHPEKQIEQIAESIRKYGMNDPIAIWGENNTIVEGHGRLYACIKLGYEQVPVVRLDDLSDEQRKAYGLVHNKLTMNSGFDRDKLKIELESIGIDLQPFGFKLDEKPLIEFNTKEISGMFRPTWKIEVELESESEQTNLYEELTKKGYVCTKI